MKKHVFPFVLAAASCASAQPAPGPCAEVPVVPLHSHNDYEQTLPLYQALDARVRSIEIDVFPGSGELLVAHDFDEIVPGRTFTSMYLDPLIDRMREHGTVYPGWPDAPPLILLVDFKGDRDASLDLLIEKTRRVERRLARPAVDGTFEGDLLIVVTGNRPTSRLLAGDPGDIYLDGRVETLTSGPDWRYAPMVSARWSSFFSWGGDGGITTAEFNELRGYAEQAAARNQLIRFWAAPDNARSWAAQLNAGVTLINTDLPGVAGSFLESALAPPRDCLADRTTSGTVPGDEAYGVRDGVVDVADLTYFVEAWVSRSVEAADLTTSSTNPGDVGYGSPDGSVTTADLLFFVEAWVGAPR